MKLYQKFLLFRGFYFGVGIKTLKIKLPILKEQTKIAQVLTIADKEIEALKNEEGVGWIYPPIFIINGG